MTRPFLLGLTGSIGMGKSTTAQMFRDAGVPVWDADATVHSLYSRGGAAVSAIAAIFPDAEVEGMIDRARLKAHIAADAGDLKRLEAVVHPLVAAHRAGFVAGAEAMGAKLLVLDIPLLFETGADRQMDATLVVTAPPQVQRARVLERPGMTETHLAAILARQMPDAEKRARADHIIETQDLPSARQEVQSLISKLGFKDA